MDWKHKLASRKFWALLAGLTTSVLLIFFSQEVAVQVSGIVLQLGSIIVYVYGESRIDAEYAKKAEPHTIEPEEFN